MGHDVPKASMQWFLHMLQAPKKEGNLIPLNSPLKLSYPLGDRLAQTEILMMRQECVRDLDITGFWTPHAITWWLLLLHWL